MDRRTGASSSSNPVQSPHSTPALANPEASAEGSQAATSSTAPGSKRRKNRGRGKRKQRRQSFAAPADHGESLDTGPHRPSLLDVPEGATTESQFGRIGGRRGSNTSLESEALLDHRDQSHTRPRRSSLMQGMHSNRSNHNHLHHPRPSYPATHQSAAFDGSRDPQARPPPEQDDSLETPTNERTPLMTSKQHESPNPKRSGGYGGLYGTPNTVRPMSGSNRRPSTSSSVSRRKRMPPRQQSSNSFAEDFDVNNPPSQPTSPRIGGEDAFDEAMMPGLDLPGSLGMHKSASHSRDAVIDLEANGRPAIHAYHGGPGTPSSERLNLIRRLQQDQAPLEDVCMPFDQMTEIAEEDLLHQEGSDRAPRRSRKKPWPDLPVLEEWSEAEKEERARGGVRAKKVNEPEMVGGRLRPSRSPWQKEEEEATFRFTYFNEELDSSLRSYTLSGLGQLGHSFRELFIPEPPELEESSDDDDEDEVLSIERSGTPANSQSRATTRHSSILDTASTGKQPTSGEQSGRTTPSRAQQPTSRPKRFGPRPVFWLDVLQPTPEEMRIISRAFGIHKLTAEDIMEQEAREKVELFRNYYFVNYRTFEQDQESEEYMDPVNMYFVVFKGGVISFHFNQMPHPPNVRRRIRQLAEHQYTDSDWIAYAIIDNITDAYAPLIEQIERDVDSIDDEILGLHTQQPSSEKPPQQVPKPRRQSKAKALLRRIKLGRSETKGDYEKIPTDGVDEVETSPEQTERDMLFRLGECRKKVMGLYRLLGNKADVIKGLAKRCNEQWQVAPRSDVGLFLGDIQDHIVTMTGNLTHYESILSRAHSNYLAQINIKMTERAEQTNDVLNKLTVLGTIVLPMNIITGMWGMNVTVPGQDNGNMLWFWGITAGLFAFGTMCFFIARQFYRVV